MLRPAILILVLCIGLALGACSSSTAVVADDADSTPSLTTLQDLPDLDVSKYDTSSTYYSAASFSAPASKAATSSGEFSRAGCELRSLKDQILNMGVFAQGFLCLYQVSEESYPTEFTIPTGSFNYYTLNESEGSMNVRVGYYPDGYGNTEEAVLVLDECENGSEQTAEMRVTASSTDQDISGAGYYIRLNESGEFEEGVEQTFILSLDSRNDDWTFSGSFATDDDSEYGNITLDYDTVNEYNELSAYHYSAQESVRLGGAFGTSSDVPTGFSVGGTVTVNFPGAEQTMVDGFVLQNSDTLPAVSLTSGTGDSTDFPFYAEMTAMGDLPAISEPSLTFIDGWDCSVEDGATAVTIDLTSSAITTAISSCEAAGDAATQMDNSCASLDGDNEGSE